MNRAQTLIPLGNGCYEYLEDISPVLVNPFTGARGHCLLAFELARNPLWRCGQTKFRQYANGTSSSVGQRQPHRVREPSDALCKRMLDALRAAWRGREKIGLSELCERVGVAASERSKYAVTKLVDGGLASREGKNRGAVYWAEEQQEEGV